MLFSMQPLTLVSKTTAILAWLRRKIPAPDHCSHCLVDHAPFGCASLHSGHTSSPSANPPYSIPKPVRTSLQEDSYQIARKSKPSQPIWLRTFVIRGLYNDSFICRLTLDVQMIDEGSFEAKVAKINSAKLQTPQWLLIITT